MLIARFDLHSEATKKGLIPVKHASDCVLFLFVYAVDEKKLTEQIQALKKEKEEALTKISELQKQVCYKYSGS